MHAKEVYTLGLQDVQKLIFAFQSEGYAVIAPKIQNGGLVLGELQKGESPVSGYNQLQEAGTCRLKDLRDDSLFTYTVPMQSWRRFLDPPAQTLFTSKIDENGELLVLKDAVSVKKQVFFGIRPCDARGVAIHDRIFLNNRYTDPYYKARRENTILIGAECAKPADTCFCTSMGLSPGYEKRMTGKDQGEALNEEALCDIILTELSPNRILARANANGSVYLQGFSGASEKEIQQGANLIEKSKTSIKRNVDYKKGVKALLNDQDNPLWEEIGERCLSCANCTLVCPTCFCTSVDEMPGIKDQSSARIRRWDSCFHISHSYIHGAHIRSSVKSRYRQWLMHKLVYWNDQFDSPGCTGCGRCITWCPAKIDLTAELLGFIESAAKPGEANIV